MLAAGRSFRATRSLPIRLASPLLARKQLLAYYSTAAKLHQFPPRNPSQSIESYVRTVREQWGHNLPEGLLSQDEHIVYRRYFGEPVRVLTEAELANSASSEVEEEGTVTLEYANGEEVEGVEVGVRSPEEAAAYDQLARDMQAAAEETAEPEPEPEFEDDGDGADLGGPLLAPDYERSSANATPANVTRTHPLTLLGRFGTYPTTVTLPENISAPSAALLSDISNKHLATAAQNLMGVGRLPNSPLMTGSSTKSYRGLTLDASQSHMKDMDANVFVGAVLPGYYAQSMSALTELRRRLGGAWVLGGAEGEPGVRRILDVGTGGAAALAWRDIAAAEKARRAEEDPDSALPIESAKVSVVTSSDALRHRMSKLLENTTFLPRLPDTSKDPNMDTVLRPGQLNQLKQPRKLYDLIVATNTIFPLYESYRRGAHVRNLWSLLEPDGGVLLLIEKGSSYGFEAIAGARQQLLRHFIASDSDSNSNSSLFVPLTHGEDMSAERIPKEPGAIIAPCTTHAECPMFVTGPMPTGRKDYCRFMQRYEQPSYTHNIISPNTTHQRNHDDLEYSYVAVRRGRDHRRLPRTSLPISLDPENPSSADLAQHSPAHLRATAMTKFGRNVFPPLKRSGHVTLDLCTPAGTIDRCIVPKSFSRIAYRDARKARWGDLWALGAKTRTKRNLRLGTKDIPKRKITHVLDADRDEVRQIEWEVDRKGGKHKNSAKRTRDRRMREVVVRRGVKDMQMTDLAKGLKGRGEYEAEVNTSREW